jgi:hypothetical protein
MRGDRIPEGYDVAELQNFDRKQMKIYRQSAKSVGKNSYLSRLAGGDQSLFTEMEAPANRQFQGQLGNLASRFSMGGGGRGSMSSRHSSGFQNQATAASSNFQQDLQSRRQELQRQAIMDMHNISQQLMGLRPKERSLVQKPEEEESGWSGMFGAGVGAIGGLAVSGGNPAMALQGAQLGYNVGSGF